MLTRSGFVLGVPGSRDHASFNPAGLPGIMLEQTQLVLIPCNVTGHFQPAHGFEEMEQTPGALILLSGPDPNPPEGYMNRPGISLVQIWARTGETECRFGFLAQSLHHSPTTW